MRRSWFRFFSVILLCGLLAAGCFKESQNNPLTVYSGYAIGTTYLVKIADTSPALLKTDIKEDILSVLRESDELMSAFTDSSELSRFNQHHQADWFRVSLDVFNVVKEALRIAELTDGAFDPSVGQLVNLWGFGPGDQEKRVPEPAEIKAKKELIGFHHIELKEDEPSVRKRLLELELDLAAIAKGYTVDKIAELLQKKGFKNYLIEIGGEIRTNGRKPDNSSWVVAIERPVAGARIMQKVVRLDKLSMATSGDYRNFFEIDGKRYSHTIDPFSGRPVDNNVASVTVVHDSCMTADALATAMTVLGSEKGIELADQFDIAVFFIIRQNNELKEIASREFQTFLNKSEMQ